MLKIIDLFSGCGGLIDGFLQTGQYESLATVDWELATIKTLKKRLRDRWGYTNTEEKVIHFDMQRSKELLCGFDDPVFGKSKGLIKIVGQEEVDLIVGGPPCQAYSMAGRVQDKEGMENDYRNYLFESYLKVVQHFQPKVFVFENVEGILTAKPGNILITERIKNAFNDIGYHTPENLRETAVFDTSKYGVPQKRKRVIILGVRQDCNRQHELKKFYEMMRNNETTDFTPAIEALKGLPKILPSLNDDVSKVSHLPQNEKDKTFLNHEPRFHNQRDIGIFKILTKDIDKGVNKYVTSKALIKLYEEMTGKTSRFHKYHVIRKHLPSNTIPAHLEKDGLRHIHPDPTQARTLTVREAARLQTFDDDYHFLGSKGEQYKMVGNAVPPSFSKVIASNIIQLI